MYSVLPVTSAGSEIILVTSRVGSASSEIFVNVQLAPGETFVATSTVPSFAPEYKLYAPLETGANATEVTATPIREPAARQIARRNIPRRPRRPLSQIDGRSRNKDVPHAADQTSEEEMGERILRAIGLNANRGWNLPAI